MRPFALLAVAALVQPAPERIADWRLDIAVAREQFLLKDRSFSPSAKAMAERRLELLDQALPRLSDVRIQAELARIAALAGNAHTRVYLLRNRGVWRRYPIHIWRFSDGWRVVAVRPGLEPLLGAELTAVEGRPVAEAERAVRSLFAGNERWARYMASYSLTSPDALQGAGFSRKAEVAFTFRTANGVVRRQLAPEPLAPRSGPEESWWFLAPTHPAVGGWVQALNRDAAPLSLAAPNRNYGLRRCAGGALYLQYFRAQDGAVETVADFTRRVLDAIGAEEPSRLVVDLRFNTGGDLTKAQPLFDALARLPLAQRRGRLFVVMGPATFSAGITPAALLRARTKAVLVGTKPGDDPEFWAEGGNVILPRSGLAMHYADRAHTYSAQASGIDPSLIAWSIDAPTLTPHRPADWRWRDYAEGRDPQLEAALGGRVRCGGIS